jgi:hypothetical protein
MENIVMNNSELKHLYALLHTRCLAHRKHPHTQPFSGVLDYIHRS